MRYRVMDVGPAGAAAFAPGLVVNPVASSYGRVHVVGSPGTAPIPSPGPVATPNFSADPLTVSSNVSPNVIFPALYLVAGPQERPPVPLRHHNNLPIPAGNPGRVALPAMRGPNVGGRRQIPWPRTFVRWPSAATVPSA